jgi:Na+-transporting methylmalonyl-CoA/oxaloacetate decarboxylase gamma subunit
MRKHLKFAAGVGVVLAVIFLIAAIVEPFVGELETQSILVPANAVGIAILAIAAALGFGS